jgi:hypothetical protein
MGQDLPTTFDCVSSTGAGGCGYDHDLEAVHLALSGNVPENAGFLRPDSLLVVFFVADEDDCSAPADTDLFSQSVMDYGVGAFGGKFRCVDKGVACNGQLVADAASNGPLANCVGAPNPMTITGDSGNSVGPAPAGEGKLMDPQRSINFFANVRAPDDLIVAAIIPPASPFQILVGNSIEQPCAPGAPLDGKNCGLFAERTCPFGQGGPDGSPPVRLNQVVTSVKNSVWLSLCAPDYSTIMMQLGQMIGARIAHR